MQPPGRAVHSTFRMGGGGKSRKSFIIARLHSIKGCPPSNVAFHQMSSSIKGHIPSKVIFHQRSSSIKGRLRKMWGDEPIRGKGALNVIYSGFLFTLFWAKSENTQALPSMEVHAHLEMFRAN